MPELGEKKLTRHQQRIADRIQKEAETMHRNLVGKFYDFFMANDPTSLEGLGLQKELSAKWKMYCKQKHLVKDVHDSVNTA